MKQKGKQVTIISKKTKLLVLIFIFFFGITIAILTLKHIGKIRKLSEAVISFKIEQVVLKDIIDYSLMQMKEHWNISEDCVIYRESFLLNEQGTINSLNIELLDTDYTGYSINISTDQQNEGLVNGTLNKSGKISNGEKTWQQGIPLSKNSEFVIYLQTSYEFKCCCSIQYYSGGKGFVDSKNKTDDFEYVFLGKDPESLYYLFHCFERNDSQKWDNKWAIFIPAQ